VIQVKAEIKAQRAEEAAKVDGAQAKLLAEKAK
jgi:hypothetical protein